jgi:hypothetical protein
VSNNKTYASTLEFLKFTLAAGRIWSREYNFSWILFACRIDKENLGSVPGGV